MTVEYANDLWLRARNALVSAEALVDISPDDAASRAYYAAFDAVSAAFALEGKTFRKHTEVRASVHRDWVKPGLWSVRMGAAFDTLWELRDIGDYGGSSHVEHEDARGAIDLAKQIMFSLGERYPRLLQCES